MKKNVWIINHFATSMMFSKGGRHYWFAKYLKRKGYEPVIFSCNAKHGIKERWYDSEELWVEQRAEDIDTPFVVVKAHLYNNNGKDRINNMISFFKNVQKAAKEYAEQHGNPDIIIASSVHPLTLVAGIKLAKFFGIKCISEVRDLWPESIFVYSSRLKKNSIIGKLLYKGEYWIYKKSDALLFTMAGGKDYIKQHKWDKEHNGAIDLNKVFHINNGVDLEEFDQNAKEFRYEDPDLDNSSAFKAVYTGSIRKVNNLDVILDTAERLKDYNVMFIIVGDGDELERLKTRVDNSDLKNVRFKGRVEKKYIPYIDIRADLNIVHWQSSELIAYGDSSNKSFEYYAAGRPILYTTNPGYSVVKQYECGVVTENQDPETIANSIMSVVNMDENKKRKMCENARRAAQYYNFDNLTSELIKIIESM